MNMYIRAIGTVNYVFVTGSYTQLNFQKNEVVSGKCQFFLVFQKTCFKVLKTFKVPIDCHVKTCRSYKRRAILKIPSTVF